MAEKYCTLLDEVFFSLYNDASTLLVKNNGANPSTQQALAGIYHRSAEDLQCIGVLYPGRLPGPLTFKESHLNST
ncbi:MAG: hypothetical protein ACWGOX_10785 [Desulforhopalus sp.]